MPAKRKDLTGKKFGKLIVIEYAYSKGYAYWRCKCDCGNENIVRSSHLLLGAVKTCGCSWSENGRKTIIFAQAANKKYDEKIVKSRLYTIWNNMKERCDDVSNKNYGGRGISICKEWRENYKTFYDWAVKNGYNDKLSIDRIDFNGNYYPENCRWANHEIQANNTRKNVFFTYGGITKSVSQWAREFGISHSTFRRWLKDGKELEMRINR
jgi:hypothetical protein